MTVRAVVFDIGGVLEITPDLGVDAKWQTRLGLSEEEYRYKDPAHLAGRLPRGIHPRRGTQ